MTFFDELQRTCGEEWPAIVAARARTAELLTRLESLQEFATSTASIIVTGSVGRREVTVGSDADWLLLVDGPSDPAHYVLGTRIGQSIEHLGLKRPGRTGTFGDLVSSHELVHHIGGTRDTNENLTRRILLLAESIAITRPILRERVIGNILGRYIVHDRPAPGRTGRPITIPHFLLNDVVRYWRTMAADYASKMWERQREGWALRNIKLRFSRKLLFVWGLLASFSFDIFPPPDRAELLKNSENFPDLLAGFIAEQTAVTPLDLLSRALFEHGKPETARKIMSSYDLFISGLADEHTRDRLQRLDFEDAPTDAIYGKLREASYQFGDGLTTLFFDDSPALHQLIRKYGVF